MNELDKVYLTNKEEQYRKKVQSKIEYCHYCQPYDGGEVVWIFGVRTELDDLFHQCKVPEKYWDAIIEHLHCPFCGHDDFEITLDVGLKTKSEIEIDNHVSKVEKLYGKQVRSLEELLENFPLLAYSNRFGKRIFNELKKQSVSITKIQGKFYRARKASNSDVLDEDKMFQPPIGKSNEGRFNHAGQSHLYLSNSKETAIREVVSDSLSSLVWSQEFEIKIEIDNILDLTFDWNELSPSTSTLLLALKLKNSIGRSDRNNELWRPDYYLTRYILDCAKFLGYNGIKYNSTKNSLEFDVVLFYPEDNKIIPIGEPSVEKFKVKKENEHPSHNFFDLND